MCWSAPEAGRLPGPVERWRTACAPVLVASEQCRSCRERAPAYTGFTPTQMPLETFRSRWLPGMARDGLHVGLKWSGDRATGFDLDPTNVEANLASREDLGAAPGCPPRVVPICIKALICDAVWSATAAGDGASLGLG